jgi:hypothetical protein
LLNSSPNLISNIEAAFSVLLADELSLVLNKTEKAASMFEMRLGDELSKVKEENREMESDQINPVAVN